LLSNRRGRSRIRRMAMNFDEQALAMYTEKLAKVRFLRILVER
jgi:hypothetical protein